jgi:YebC/PmpR family DNA-binding regulatory protein
MPNDTIERAIKKGTGEIAGGVLEELIYEGYGPGGAAIIVEAATDNKNRTAADIRSIFSKNHGHLAASGAVSYMFRRKGLITVARGAVEEERLMDIALEAGAEDLAVEDESFVVTTPQDRLYQVGEALRIAGVTAESQKLTFLPGTMVTIDQENQASQILRLCDALEENDDVQNVYSNFDISDELLTRLSN